MTDDTQKKLKFNVGDIVNHKLFMNRMMILNVREQEWSNITGNLTIPKYTCRYFGSNSQAFTTDFWEFELE